MANTDDEHAGDDPTAAAGRADPEDVERSTTASFPSTTYFDLLRTVVGEKRLTGDEKKFLLMQLKG